MTSAARLERDDQETDRARHGASPRVQPMAGRSEQNATITPETRLIALLGDPVSQSRSPLMQNAAFAAAGMDGVYVAIRCAAAHVAGLVAGIAHANGGGNITIPHKAAAVAPLERKTDAVVATGACNTFWLESGRICGDNTDVHGFRAAVETLLGSYAGIRALVVGAGGAARAAAVGLAAGDAARIEVLNRSIDRAHRMRDDLAHAVPGLRVIDRAALNGEAFDLIVNATSLGLDDADPPPLDLDIVDTRAVLDLVCRPGGTPLTKRATAAGIPAAEGTTMLIAQGAAAFERWWRMPAPIDAMRRVLDAS